MQRRSFLAGFVGVVVKPLVAEAQPLMTTRTLVGNFIPAALVSLRREWSNSARGLRFVVIVCLAAQPIVLGLGQFSAPAEPKTVYASPCPKPIEPSLALSSSGEVLGNVIDAYETDGRCFYIIERPGGTLWAPEASRVNVR